MKWGFFHTQGKRLITWEAPTNLLEKVLIFCVSQVARTDLKKVLTFRVSWRAPIDLLEKEITFRVSQSQALTALLEKVLTFRVSLVSQLTFWMFRFGNITLKCP